MLVLTAVAAAETDAGHASAQGTAVTPGCTASSTTSTDGASFTASETLCRSYFDQGVVDVRNFQVNVSDTQGLRDGQVVSVSWSGAHPTGGIYVAGQQEAAASQQEFPVVLMECRGVDSTSVPASEQLSPETCWTASAAERVNGQQQYWPPPWQLDMYNSPAQQAAQVNLPNPLPAACGSPSYYEYVLPFIAADGTNYPIGPQGCAGAPPEMFSSNEPTAYAPSDTTYASTALNGTGSDKFTVMTSETNESLGCSQTVVCSLVIVPIEGISCNANPVYFGAPQYTCENPGDFAPGELNEGQSPDGPALSDEGQFWWSQSNWQRRISVPLNFATPGDACAANTSAPLQFYGSELMIQATQQWNPYFCLNPKLFNVEQVALAEPQAKTLVQQGDVGAAIEGSPPSQSGFFTTPTVQAPIGVSGFAISYVIDNADGTPYTELKLDPRLLAKLMTESYYGTNNVQSGDTAIANNPVGIVADPEFQALNPDWNTDQINNIQLAPTATLFSINTQSDVIWALTSYINSDPEARAWLNGQPDPWGMTVNPAYKGIKLPVDHWPLLDTSTNGPDYDGDAGVCTPDYGTGASKIPDRPLIDNPQASLYDVAYNLSNNDAASLVACNGQAEAPSLIPLGQENLGERFLIGVVSLPEAETLNLDTAQLQTYADPEVESRSTTQFLGNRTFTGPTTASLQAATDLLQPDSGLGSWVLPYSDFQADTAAEGAYPGTMLLSADVPTHGLPATEAAQYGQYLAFAAGTGQAQGPAVGQVPAGYLPMTTADGLGAEVAYTQAAATDVTKQNGQVPPLAASKATGPTTATTTPANRGPGGQSSPGSTSGSSPGATTSGATSTPASGSTASTTVPVESGGRKALTSQAESAIAAARAASSRSSLGKTIGLTEATGAVAVLVALILAIVGGVLSGVQWWRRRRPVGS
jgi:hypothetical protein